MAEIDSAPVTLLSHVWRHLHESTGHSWLKTNHAMHTALFLAVRGGMGFAETDLATISQRFRMSYWCGDLEYFYREAVLYRNNSAWKAFEHHRGRMPFIWPGAYLNVGATGDGPCGYGLSRVVIGAQFEWKGESVRVTSITDGDFPHLTACSYQRTEDRPCPRCDRCYSCSKRGKEKILHRFTISHADLRAARPKKSKSVTQGGGE